MVYLDLTHIDRATLDRKLGGILDIYEKFVGVDPHEEPIYETVREWRNRQRMKLTLPLFPTYLFARINFKERVKVLQSPGVLQIVGDKRECAYLPDSEVELLRSGFCRQRFEPYRELVIGERVRIKNGVMQGLQGTLIRKSNNTRFVLTIELINQHAAIRVDAEDLESIDASS